MHCQRAPHRISITNIDCNSQRPSAYGAFGEYTKQKKGGAGVFLAPAVRWPLRAAPPAHGTRRSRHGPAGYSGSVTRGRAQPPSLLRGAARLGTGRKDLLAVVLGRLPLVARLSDEVCFRLLSAASVGASALNPLDSLVVLRERGPVTMSFRLSWHSFSLMYVSMAAL